MYIYTFYRTYKDQCNKNHSTGEEEEYCKPDREETKGMKPFNYDKLDDDGFIKENAYVSNNDIIMGKRMPNKVNDTAEAYKFKDIYANLLCCIRHLEIASFK